MDDDVTINDSGEVAVIAGKIRVEIVRVAGEGGDQFRLRFEFPGEPEIMAGVLEGQPPVASGRLLRRLLRRKR